ncbi:outer membrane autotransporter barrel domain-containing protein/outer membrane insertion C-terminal signal [Vreelandella subterranea]|uniref:Outer membrane autotransporter barrel domain-containing protein/outer membrane insertion C-terminal signal n=1 Tax=Vreelandella subterranea TaxID=416874 RepID=A0A1H9T9F1_9GAMM|nr:porin family protein [Halomonas subterranea]SER93564.1 outer membrane autotransporter barrel domain-containing protein/outer membrane insertion C-terminal signal [Halomonas subterranea]
MKTSILSLTSAVLLVGAGTFAASAQAQQSFTYPQGYVGGDAMFWSLDPDGGSSRDDVGLRLRGGAQFNDYFALEGHLGTGGSDGGAELDHLAGAYAKGIIPVAPEVRLYGLAGFTEVDFDSDRESDFSYGAGAEMDVAPNVSLGADYMRYLDKSSYTFDAASVGLRYRF